MRDIDEGKEMGGDLQAWCHAVAQCRQVLDSVEGGGNMVWRVMWAAMCYFSYTFAKGLLYILLSPRNTFENTTTFF